MLCFDWSDTREVRSPESRVLAILNHTDDTIPIPPHKRLPNLQVLTVSPLLGEGICRAHEGRGVGEMFYE